MVIRVVDDKFVPETPPGSPEVIGMFEELLKQAKAGRITSAACAFTDHAGGGGAFGPLEGTAAMATSLMGALENLKFQMHIASSAMTSLDPTS